MVKKRQDRLEERTFHNRSRPGLGVEVFSLAELRRRVGGHPLTAAHRLDFHQITLISKGRGSAVIDFESYDCRPGTLLHVRPGQVQRLPRSSTDSAEHLEGTLVLFTRTFVQRPGLDSGLGTDVWQLEPSSRRQLGRALNELAAEYRQESWRDADSVALLRHLLSVVLIRIARLPAHGADLAEPNPGFVRFRQQVERSFAQTRRVADYAATLGYSARTLTRLSVAATGHSAKQVIDDRVTLEAKRLLTHTDQPIASIARALGFSEPTNFGKFFLAQTGQTPSRFRADERSG